MGFEILCDRCRKPVDRVETALWPANMGVEVAAYCHGERESHRLSPFDIRDIESGTIGGALAFRVATDAGIPEGFAVVRGVAGMPLLIDLRDPEPPPQNVTAHDRDGSTTSHVARSTENGTL